MPVWIGHFCTVFRCGKIKLCVCVLRQGIKQWSDLPACEWLASGSEKRLNYRACCDGRSWDETEVVGVIRPAHVHQTSLNCHGSTEVAHWNERLLYMSYIYALHCWPCYSNDHSMQSHWYDLPTTIDSKAFVYCTTTLRLFAPRLIVDRQLRAIGAWSINLATIEVGITGPRG